MTAAEVIALLKLERHPEGGWYARRPSEDAVPRCPRPLDG